MSVKTRLLDQKVSQAREILRVVDSARLLQQYAPFIAAPSLHVGKPFGCGRAKEDGAATCAKECDRCVRVVPLCNTAFTSLCPTLPDRNCAISAGCWRSGGHLLSDRHAKRKQVHATPLALETQLHERLPRQSTDLIRWVARPPARHLAAFSTRC